MEEDCYSFLGLQHLGPRATPRDVRKAFMGLALKFHPDKQAGKSMAEVAAAAAEFEKVQKAMHILGNESSKRAYDHRRQKADIFSEIFSHKQKADSFTFRGFDEGLVRKETRRQDRKMMAGTLNLFRSTWMQDGVKV